jgi:hypothetical protein
MESGKVCISLNKLRSLMTVVEQDGFHTVVIKFQGYNVTAVRAELFKRLLKKWSKSEAINRLFKVIMVAMKRGTKLKSLKDVTKSTTELVQFMNEFITAVDLQETRSNADCLTLARVLLCCPEFAFALCSTYGGSETFKCGPKPFQFPGSCSIIPIGCYYESWTSLLNTMATTVIYTTRYSKAYAVKNAATKKEDLATALDGTYRAWMQAYTNDAPPFDQKFRMALTSISPDTKREEVLEKLSIVSKWNSAKIMEAYEQASEGKTPIEFQ